MKFIYTADLHFSSYNQDKMDPSNNLPERLSSIFYVFTNMIEFGIQNNILNLVIGGDTFHNKNLIHSIAQSVLLDIVRKHKKMKFYFVDGNHDLSSMVGDGVSATKCLDNEENVVTIHETKTIENILMVPWNPKRMINEIKTGTEPYLIAHLGLNEGMLNSGISLVSDIGLTDLKNYKKVYLGHYHKPQSVGNCTYVGSPLQLDWGEKNEEKRFLVIDSNTGKEDSVLTTGYKKYCEFNLSSNDKKEVIEKANFLKSEGHHVKLNKIDDVDISDIQDDYNIVDKVETDITNRGITSEMSSSDKLDRYLEIKNIFEEKRVLYKNMALEIIEKSSVGG